MAASSRREHAARIDTAARVAQDRVRETILAFKALTLDAMVPTGNPDHVARWWGTYFATLAALEDALDSLRTIRETARRAVQRTVRIYTVRPGDTLESIARQTLGNGARASELGLRPEDLSEGRAIRIPEGT